MKSIDELIANLLPDDPLPLDAYANAFQQIGVLCAPAFFGAIILFLLALASLQLQLAFEFVGLFLIGSFAMAFFIVFGVATYQHTTEYYDWLKRAHAQRLTFAYFAVQHLTIIQKARDVTIENTNQTTNFLLPEIDRDLNDTYGVAKVILQEALKAWQHAGGQRPRDHKPIAFDAIVRLTKTGHPKWQDANKLLHDANVLLDGTKSNWQVLIDDETKALQQIDAHLVQQGKIPMMNEQGEIEWRRLQQGAQNG